MTTPSTMAKASRSPLPTGVEVLGKITPAFSEILTPEALAFVAKLQRHFGTRRKQCLEHRQKRQIRLDQGEGLDFSPETKQIREGDWKCVAISIDRRAPKPLSLLANQPPQCLLIRPQKLGDPLVVDVGDDDLADLGVDLAEDAVRPHLCDLVLVVLCGGNVVHRGGLETVHQEEVDEGH